MTKSTAPKTHPQRPDLVKKPKTPQTARPRQLWIHNPDQKQVKGWLKLAKEAYETIPWSAPTPGESRVKQANRLAVEHGVHREIVYVLRRAHHFFQERLGAVLQDIGLHRLSVLLMAHENAESLYKQGVPTKRGGKRKAIRLYKTEELRHALRKLLGRSRRGPEREGEKGMKIVRGSKFRSGTLAANLKRVLGYLDTGLQQTLKRLRSAGRVVDRTNRTETVEKFLSEVDDLVRTFRGELKTVMAKKPASTTR